LIPQSDIKGVFTAVQNAKVERGVVPFENSTNGSVIQTLDLFADIKNENPSIRVCGEALVPVQHCLLGRRRDPPSITSENGNLGTSSIPQKSKTEPEPQDFSYIQKLYSHPQAWTQCTPFLTQHLSHAKREDTTSTSQAAELVANDPTGTSAAICSRLSAELYNLDILVAGIEEKEGNTTKFLLLQQKPINSPIAPSTSLTLKEPILYPSETRNNLNTTTEEGPPKSLLTFTVPHSDPGALGRALGVFGTYEINLTSMHTRPSGERAWHYLFFIELEGQRGDVKVESALGELSKVVEKLRICGSWRGVSR
jgi:prephenate dehydratase